MTQPFDTATKQCVFHHAKCLCFELPNGEKSWLQHIWVLDFYVIDDFVKDGDGLRSLQFCGDYWRIRRESRPKLDLHTPYTSIVPTKLQDLRLLPSFTKSSIEEMNNMAANLAEMLPPVTFVLANRFCCRSDLVASSSFFQIIDKSLKKDGWPWQQ